MYNVCHNVCDDLLSVAVNHSDWNISEHWLLDCHCWLGHDYSSGRSLQEKQQWLKLQQNTIILMYICVDVAAGSKM